MQFVLGQRYTRRAIHEQVGGDLQSYLPHVNGQVVCGCFDPDMNKRAPFEIDIGNLPDVLRYADVLSAQAGAIPIFLKRGNFDWEFVGHFMPVRLTRDESDLYPTKAFRRKDAVAMLYFSPADADSNEEQSEALPIWAEEGTVTLRKHQNRERSRILVEAKRRAFRAEFGALCCEACSMSESELPAGLGESCFDVHHLELLGARAGPVITTLNDLALLCANCHRMIHRSSPMLKPAELSQVLRSEA